MDFALFVMLNNNTIIGLIHEFYKKGKMEKTFIFPSSFQCGIVGYGSFQKIPNFSSIYLCVCVCVCVCTHMRACMRVC